MKRLYVGCRVSIIWSINFPELAGQLGTIIAKASGAIIDGVRCEWEVAVDNWGRCSCPPYEFATFSPSSEQLEPATDSYDVVGWDECIWQPEILEVFE